jgi:hypothetical protein
MPFSAAPSLRQYVRHAEMFGGYDSVFDEAAQDLNPQTLARLCSAMRDMSHDYRSGTRRMTERFVLNGDAREALALALIGQDATTATVADLLGCSSSYVRKLKQKQWARFGTESQGRPKQGLEVADQGSERPETGGQNSTGEGGNPITLGSPLSAFEGLRCGSSASSA